MKEGERNSRLKLIEAAGSLAPHQTSEERLFTVSQPKRAATFSARIAISVQSIISVRFPCEIADETEEERGRERERYIYPARILADLKGLETIERDEINYAYRYTAHVTH